LRSLAAKFTAVFRSPSPPRRAPERQISPELLEKIRHIQIKTDFLVNSVIAGEYVSAFKGVGMEFAEVREYLPGDDVRLIDWNVTARFGHPFVKKFREERELTVMLVVDASSSGEFGSRSMLKRDAAAEIASILAFSAIKNNDKVGLIVFSDKIERYIPPKKGRAHVWNVIRAILNFAPEGRLTDLNVPLRYLLNVQKRKTATFLISDFQAEGYEKSLKMARQKHDIIAIAVTDPRELDLPENIGFVHLEDAETGESILVDTFNKNVVEHFRSKKREERLRIKKELRAMGIDIMEIQIDKPLIDPIIRFFKTREKKR
jgi:uncharacterized protein (DUF58 family)